MKYKKISVAVNVNPGDARSHLCKEGNVYYPHCTLVDCVKLSIIGSRKQNPGKIADKKVGIQFLKENGELWMPNPENPDDVLTVDPKAIFEDKRWTVFDRAKQLRMYTVWRSIREPLVYGEDLMERIKEQEQRYKLFYESNVDELATVLVTYFIEENESL